MLEKLQKIYQLYMQNNNIKLKQKKMKKEKIIYQKIFNQNYQIYYI